ncbi:MAG: hypothetical protein AAGD38_04620 [Acidobacteriota bacterium]
MRRFVVSLLAVWITGCSGIADIVPLRQEPLDPELAPWRLPDRDLMTQRLFRVNYEGPEGDLDFKLVLYLADRSRYRMVATDTLGRTLWELAVEPGDEALWINHYDEVWCLARGSLPLHVLPLAHLPLDALPRLLLGRMPVAPVGEVNRDEKRFVFADAAGQTWQAELSVAGGPIDWWSLTLDDEPAAWYRRDGERGVFSDRRGKQQLRWREVFGESLGDAWASSEAPTTYAEMACAGARLFTVTENSSER